MSGAGPSAPWETLYLGVRAFALAFGTPHLCALVCGIVASATGMAPTGPGSGNGRDYFFPEGPQEAVPVPESHDYLLPRAAAAARRS